MPNAFPTEPMRPARLLLVLALAAAPGVRAAEPQATTIDLAAEASRPAANDLAVASAYFEATGRTPTAVADEVNRAVAAALDTTRGYRQVKTRTAGTHTWPVYGRDGGKLEGWRMRSELRLESRDLAALSELLGKLQATLAVSQLALEPAAETRREAADAATVEAIRNFQARATTVAEALGKHYRIRHLGIGESIPPRPFVAMRAAKAGEAAAPPLEAGESEIAVTVNGTIELTD